MEDIFTMELPDLPEPLSDRFEMISCIKHSGECSVYLLKEKKSRRQLLLKASSDPVIVQTLENEKQILDAIHTNNRSRLEAAFPRAICLERFEKTVYYIRTFITGKTLEDLCESNPERPGLMEDQALDYVIHLAELLHFLHSMTPPVIHRDIKPQNVIVDNDGNCHFIDMGISRFFDVTQSHDTLIMGTTQMAPPEQFGFRQTDKRSDIYSLGILMYYCITGEYTVTEKGLKKLRHPTRRIIQKATMFDPDQRYTDAKEMMSDLLDARFRPYLGKSRRFPSGRASSVASPATSADAAQTKQLMTGKCSLWAAGILFFLFILGGFIFLGHRAKDQPYSFAEPLLEEAVCRQLGKPSGTITEADLAQVKEIHIFGNQIYEDESEVWLHGSYPWFYDEEIREAGLYLQSGSIQTLTDISHMPNLETLCLYQQQIMDISALKDTKITCLGLGYNPLTDLSALEGNSSIRQLLIPCVFLSDTEVLGTLPALRELNISGTDIKTLSFLAGSPVERLNLFQLLPDDYGALKELPNLSALELDHMDQAVMAQLEGLAITELSFYYSENFALSDIRGLAQLETLTFFGDQGPLFEGTAAVDLPALKELILSYMEIKDFHFLKGLDALITLNIYNATCTGYEGLDALPNLKNVIATEKQTEKLRSAFLFSFAHNTAPASDTTRHRFR